MAGLIAVLLVYAVAAHTKTGWGDLTSDVTCPTSSEVTGCWRLSDSHCVCLLNPGYSQGYYAADAFCNERFDQGTLISVHSEQENMVLQEHINASSRDAWLGLQVIDSAFVWTDGTRTDYFNWESDTIPSPTDLACAHMNYLDGSWIWNQDCFNPQVTVACGVRAALPPSSTAPSPQPSVNPLLTVVIVTAGVCLIAGVVLITLIITQLKRRNRPTHDEQSQLLDLTQT